MAGTPTSLSEFSEPSHGVVVPVPASRLFVGAGGQEEVSLLSNQQEEEPIDDSKQLAVEVNRADIPLLKTGPEISVGPVVEEAGPEGGDRCLDAVAKMVECPGALGARLDAPTLDPVLLGLGSFEAGLMGEEPQDHEVAVNLSVHHRLEVELNGCLPGERQVVPQEPETESVGHEPPEAGGVPVQQFLEEGVRARAGCSRDARSATVQLESGTHQMDRNGCPGVGDREAETVDLERARWGQATVAELGEQDQQPSIAGKTGGWIALPGGIARLGERRPRTDQP